MAVAAERIGGLPPEPAIEGEQALRAEIIEEVRRRLGLAPEDRSEEAFRAIEDVIDAEMEAIGEPIDEEAALARVRHLVI